MGEVSVERPPVHKFTKTAEREAIERRRQRFSQLATPKTSKTIWATVEPPLTWGNQDPMRPISTAALNTNASERLSALATPKKNFQFDHPQKCSRHCFVYSAGRSSVIWDVSPLAMKSNPSERIEELSKPKKLTMGYSEDRSSYVLGCGRSSPIWGITSSAKKAALSDRVEALSHPKIAHREYQPPRGVQWPVSQSAKSGTFPDHIETLSRPKERNDGAHRDSVWKVSKGARSTQASSRVQELAQPKKYTDGYQQNREGESRVARSALRAAATERLKELSNPIIRDTMDHVQFDPLAFQVKETALKGRVPDRIHDLAIPVIRGPKN